MCDLNSAKCYLTRVFHKNGYKIFILKIGLTFSSHFLSICMLYVVRLWRSQDSSLGDVQINFKVGCVDYAVKNNKNITIYLLFGTKKKSHGDSIPRKNANVVRAMGMYEQNN